MSKERTNNVSKGTSEIIRVKRVPNSFVQMHKGFFEDARLSFKAKGILGYLLTKPDSWEVRIGDLMNRSKDGRDSVYAGLKELKEHGYFRKIQVRDKKGRLSHWECFICEVPMPETDSPHTEKPYTAEPCSEIPHTENPETAKPHTGKPHTGNPSLSNNNLTKNQSRNIHRNNTDFSNNKPTQAPPDAPTATKGSGEAAGAGDKIQYAEFVRMTNNEYSLLIEKIGVDGALWCIEKLDNYKGSTGKTYDSDYRTILSWVVVRYQGCFSRQCGLTRLKICMNIL